MSEQALEKQSLDQWQAGLLRLSAFPSPAVQIGEPTWWNDLVGDLPEKRTSQPKTGEFLEEGKYGDNKLILGVQATRIDWTLIPQEEIPEAAIFLTLGSFLESLEEFIELMSRWFQLVSCPTVQRLAFGAVGLLSVESLQAGYRQISAYFPFDFNGENASDFNYQINRRRDSVSGTSDLKINRLSKWSVASVMLSGITLSPRVTFSSAHQSSYACRLELDINTAQEFQGEIAREQLPQTFRELTDLGKEIVEKGDIP